MVEMGDDELRRDYWNLVKSKQLKARVVLVTTLGPIAIEVHANLVPKTAENFIELCEHGLYNKTKFHRVIPGFMAQGGDPTNTGSGGSSYTQADGGNFNDEFHPDLNHD